MAPVTTVDAMTEAQESSALQQIRDSQNRDRGTSVAQYVQDVKSSVLYRPGFDWSELLSASPMAVSLLASLFVASASSDAAQIKILPPKGGFQYLQNVGQMSLNTCLTQCVDKGLQSLGTSAASFDRISLKSGTIKQMVNQTVQLLGDPESASQLLVPTIETLSRVAGDCEGAAKSIETAFTEWLNMVCELHKCVVQTSSDASEQQAANQVHLAAARTTLVSPQDAQKMAGESVSILKASLESMASSYKKALDEYPASWDLVSQQFLTDLMDTSTVALNLAVPALIENFSMTAKLEEGLNIFAPGNGGAEGGSVGDGQVNHANVQAATSAPTVVPTTELPFPNDPAYGVIGLVQGFVTTIQSFLTGGSNKGVDWAVLRAKDSQGANNGLGVMAALMDGVSKSFKPSSNAPSQALLGIFATVKQVTDAVQATIAANANTNDNNSLPQAGSPDVVKWQMAIATAAAKAVQLHTDSKALSTARKPPMVNPPKAQSSPTDKTGAFRQQIINATAIKLEQTSKVTQTMSDNYQNSSNKLNDVQNKLGEIQGELKSLNATNMSLKDTRSVLVKQIDFLVEIKSQMHRLVAFYSAVGTLVNYLVDAQVKPFINHIMLSPGGEKSILDVSFTEFQSQVIFGFALNIRAYFDLFRDVALMYGDVNNRFARGGLQMVESMQAEYNSMSPGDSWSQKRLQQKTMQVASFVDDASKGVRSMITQKQGDIAQSLNENAAQSADQVLSMPFGPAPDISRAIKDSTDNAKAAATQGIAKSGTYLTRKLANTSSPIVS